jgi:nitrogen regulatory protein PII
MAGTQSTPQGGQKSSEGLSIFKQIILTGMKGIFIAYDQAYNMDIADAIQKIGVRGFTMWQDIAGRGSETGEPHLGNHAWPTMNNAMLTFVPDENVDEIMAQLRAMDEETPDLGLRAFVWNVEKYY